jgi:hypothetical protein
LFAAVTIFNTHPGMDRITDPDILRRLLRAKGPMDEASHEDWPVRRWRA